MGKMAQALAREGFFVVNLDYPSTQRPIEDLALEAVPEGVRQCAAASARPIHFVTHSMGGLLVRYYLDNHPLPALGRIVMLSPPNQGSEAADALRDTPVYRWVNGPAGLQLGTGGDGIARRLGPVAYPVGVITGNRHAPFDAWLAEIIPGEDDGKVAVERAKVSGMSDFLVLPYSHPFIMRQDRVIEETIRFLHQGRFDQGEPGKPE